MSNAASRLDHAAPSCLFDKKVSMRDRTVTQPLCEAALQLLCVKSVQWG